MLAHYTAGREMGPRVLSGISTSRGVWAEGQGTERGRWVREGREEQRERGVMVPGPRAGAAEVLLTGCLALGCAHLGPHSCGDLLTDKISCPGDKLLGFCAE